MTELAKNSNDLENPHTGWKEIAGGPAENESTETRAELSRSESLKRALDELTDFYSKNKAILPEDALKALGEAHSRIENQIEEAKLDECVAFLPESRRESFRNLVSSHFLNRDVIIEATFMRAAGKSDSEIFDYVTSRDYNGQDDEINRQRGESVYNNIINAIGKQE